MTEEKKIDVRKSNQRQLMGMLAGGGLGLMIYAVYPVLDLFSTVILCALVGVLAFSLDRLEAAGKIITKRESRWLNIAVGVIVPLIFLVGLALLLR